MKVLFFRAAASHPNVAPALMGQAENVLRPFNRFISQAIHTAKQRQTRYQLPWERVRNLSSIRLEPIDSLLRVPRRLPGVVLTDWPAGTSPDLGQMGFVVNRGLPVSFEAATPTTNGLLVRAHIALLPTDEVIWCGIKSAVTQEAAPSPPRLITDLAGKLLKLAAPARADDAQHWLLCIEGDVDNCDLLVDGEEVSAEALQKFEGLCRVIDCDGTSFDVSGGTLRVEQPPAEGYLRGDNGVRYLWREGEGTSRRGCWIQLLPPESSEADEFIDPRAAFCEGDVSEVQTEKRRSKDTTFRVKKVDQDRYQLLLDNYPPEKTTLYLPVDLRNLYLQQRALRQLMDAPLPHHRGLLRLCEDPQKAQWPEVNPTRIADGSWRALTDATRSGTDEQRTFVQKALGSPDLAFLEGPPGSGKTTAICEIVQQLVERGERVLLCASTHVAIDNVLERLLQSSSPIDAVRIGKLDKVDDKVQSTQLDERVNQLVEAWRRAGMAKYGVELEEMAERAVIMAANLTCGTTMGIVNHPLFRGRDEDMNVWERPITTMPHWDVLIVDEASKTLIQEFMVPALMTKRWIIVGDVRQLPPFADRADLVANLRDLVNEEDKPLFPPDHQRACLLLFRLLMGRLRQTKMRWLIVERLGVLDYIERELGADPVEDLSVVRVVRTAAKGHGSGEVDVVTTAQLRAGEACALRLAAADWVLVSDEIIAEVAELLPANLLIAEVLAGAARPLAEGASLLTRQSWWLARSGQLERSYKERKFRREDVATFADAQACEADWFSRNDLAQELAWRLTRLHELRHSNNRQERERLRRDLNNLQPKALDIGDSLAELEDIGLPSILEVLQEGIGEERAKRRSALTAGLSATRPADFDARFESLSYQHRMHPQIADFSREIIYDGQSLLDANTIQSRDARLGWDFGPLPARRVWAHVAGREQGGVNSDEVKAIAETLRAFIAWARVKGPLERDLPRVWEVACLCFYVKQERALADMLREVTGDDRKTRFMVRDAPVEIVCGTVDRFQGREADLVMLSMRNTQRVGFLDSPNRLNVAVTRARQQLVIFGRHDYFKDCGVYELEALATQTQLFGGDEKTLRRSKR
jgi:hypothetical protein